MCKEQENYSAVNENQKKLNTSIEKKNEDDSIYNRKI